MHLGEMGVKLGYLDVNCKILPTSVYFHHNIYVGRSYVRIRGICCHSLFFLRYEHDDLSTIGTSNSPLYLHLLASVLS